MAYRSKEHAAATALARITRRREEWIKTAGSTCSSCGSAQGIHIVQTVNGHRRLPTGRSVFGQSKEAMDKILSTCVLLCGNCGGADGHKAGETAGDRLLVKYMGQNPHGHHTWMWKCAGCGEVRGPSTLAHAKRFSGCGSCANSRDNNPRWKGYQEITGVFLGYYQHSAKKRGLVWDITPEYLWELWVGQESKCAYTGRLLVHGVDASIDRIDSSIGYVEGNLQWVHRDVNWMKNNYTEERFLDICFEVANYRNIE